MSKAERTRAALIGSAARGFRKEGYAGVGVDSIAKQAGVTSGAFYAHLGSKNGAFRAVLEAGLDEVVDTLPIYRAEHGDQWPQAFVDYYLGTAHRADVECGCAMTGLTPDVVRADAETRTDYAQKMDDIVAEIVKGLPAHISDSEGTGRAWGFLSALVGGLTLARAVGASDAAEIIAETSKTSALAALGHVARDRGDGRPGGALADA